MVYGYIYYTPWYHDIFSRNRFEILYSIILHVSSQNWILLEYTIAELSGYILSLEGFITWWNGGKVESSFKIQDDNSNKPEKYHIKTFGLCDSITGYAYNLLIYFGKETSYQQGLECGQSEKVFEYLLRPLGPGHHIFADRYYTTYDLILYLFSKKTYYTRTLMTNSKKFPVQIKNSKTKHLESCYYWSERGILLYEWKDKKVRKPVVIISTHETKGEVDVSNKRGIVTPKPKL